MHKSIPQIIKLTLYHSSSTYKTKAYKVTFIVTVSVPCCYIVSGALVAYEGIHLHSPYFAKLWCEIYQAEKTDKDYIKQLCQSNYLIDYMEAILHDERSSLNNQHIYQFFTFYFKLVSLIFTVI